MKTYVVMPHYIITEHIADLAKKAIESFKKTSECILISCDDESPYEDVGFLEEMSDVYIRNKKNKGFAGNCNVGFKWILENEEEECNVICANNDILVYDGWLEEFKKYKYDAICGLGYRVDIIEGRPLSEYKTNPQGKWTKNEYSDSGRFEDWMFSGAFYMIKKSLLEEYGLYDEGFVHGGYEDIDLFLRWKNARKKLVVTPKVPYWHEEGATRYSERELETQNKAEFDNRAYFKKKWGFDAHEEMPKLFIDRRIKI